MNDALQRAERRPPRCKFAASLSSLGRFAPPSSTARVSRQTTRSGRDAAALLNCHGDLPVAGHAADTASIVEHSSALNLKAVAVRAIAIPGVRDNRHAPGTVIP